MTSHSRPPRIVIMCKAPIPGKVKTRLITAEITAEESCALHEEMARVVIKRAALLFPDRVIIATDDPDHPFFSEFDLPLMHQSTGSLGRRMQCIADQLIEETPVLFLGTDAPHMTPKRLQEAIQAAQTHDAVIGPVEDGGYDLILLAHRAALALLHDIPWGSSEVAEQTAARAAVSGLSLAMLTRSFDVDNMEDLARSRAVGWPLPAAP